MSLVGLSPTIMLSSCHKNFFRLALRLNVHAYGRSPVGMTKIIYANLLKILKFYLKSNL